jgi:hypothetical protein
MAATWIAREPAPQRARDPGSEGGVSTSATPVRGVVRRQAGATDKVDGHQSRARSSGTDSRPRSSMSRIASTTRVAGRRCAGLDVRELGAEDVRDKPSLATRRPAEGSMRSGRVGSRRTRRHGGDASRTRLPLIRRPDLRIALVTIHSTAVAASGIPGSDPGFHRRARPSSEGSAHPRDARPMSSSRRVPSSTETSIASGRWSRSMMNRCPEDAPRRDPAQGPPEVERRSSPWLA